MTEPVQPLTYRGKIDTVENLARTLIVASAVQPADSSGERPDAASHPASSHPDGAGIDPSDGPTGRPTDARDV